MNSKAIAVTAVFAALTIVLNPAFSKISIPAPFFPFISYEIWEIPIVVVFLLVGFRQGMAVAFINAIVLLLLFPRYTVIGSIIASIAMLSGFYLGYKLINRKNSPENKAFFKENHNFVLTGRNCLSHFSYDDFQL